MSGWQDISTAPELDRVLVAGWQKRSGTVAGYWWWSDDVIINGRAVRHTSATLWAPVVLPAFPTSPTGEAQ